MAEDARLFTSSCASIYPVGVFLPSKKKGWFYLRACAGISPPNGSSASSAGGADGKTSNGNLGPRVVTPHNPSGAIPVALGKSCPIPNQGNLPRAGARSKPLFAGLEPFPQAQQMQPPPVICVDMPKPAKAQQLHSDLQGVVLMLGGPGSG